MSNGDNAEEALHLEQAAHVRITMSLTPRQAFNLMLKLSSDDAFRDQVKKNPHEVLSKYGIDVPSRDIPLERALPPKEQLQEVLLQMFAGRPGIVTELPFNVDPFYWQFIDFLIFLAAPAHRQAPPAAEKV
jgi:putative modified peptide